MSGSCAGSPRDKKVIEIQSKPTAANTDADQATTDEEHPVGVAGDRDGLGSE